MPVSGKKVVAILVKAGWKIIGQRGSHVKLSFKNTTVIVPIHSNRDLGIGLIRSIEKHSGVKIL